MKKASLALWILTKFAIIFFILALGAILMTFTAQYKQKICEEQAGFIARQILGNINGVITSGSEDEIKTLKIDPTLKFLGEDVRYSINITTLPPGAENGGQIGAVIVDVVAPQKCAAHLNTNFTYQGDKAIDKTFIVDGLSPNSANIILNGATDPLSGGKVYTFEPTDKVFTNRLKYFIFLKCDNKYPTANKYAKFLFIQGCTQETATACLDFESNFNGEKLSTKKYCGWND